jgi:flagellar motor switch protein FliN
MSVTHASPAVQKFCEFWKDAFLSVLGQLGVVSPSGSIIGQPAAVTSPLDSEQNVVARFSGSGVLQGDLYLLAEKSIAVSCAQLLMAEAPSTDVTFAESHRDAFLEFLRQVAGQAATLWKEETGHEIELKFLPDGQLALDSPLNAGIRLSGEKIPELSLSLLLTQSMCASLDAPKGPSEAKAEPGVALPTASASSIEPQLPGQTAESSQVIAPGPLPGNLDLLLDVELEATIRFGRHEMLLREVFGLLPGVVVELDQLVNEPAELLVAGRLIARGEVVVVDGNFGLQVTEVASERQRAEILQL